MKYTKGIFPNYICGKSDTISATFKMFTVLINKIEKYILVYVQ